MSNPLKVLQANASNPKLWILIGVGVAGVVILAETRRRGRNGKVLHREDFGAFIHRFELQPFPQPPPPAARQPLAGLTFAVKDVFVLFLFFLFDVCINIQIANCDFLVLILMWVGVFDRLFLRGSLDST